MGVNLNEKLLHNRRKRIVDSDVLDQVYEILESDAKHESAIETYLSNSHKNKRRPF